MHPGTRACGDLNASASIQLQPFRHASSESALSWLDVRLMHLSQMHGFHRCWQATSMWLWVRRIRHAMAPVVGLIYKQTNHLSSNIPEPMRTSRAPLRRLTPPHGEPSALGATSPGGVCLTCRLVGGGGDWESRGLRALVSGLWSRASSFVGKRGSCILGMAGWGWGREVRILAMRGRGW